MLFEKSGQVAAAGALATGGVYGVNAGMARTQSIVRAIAGVANAPAGGKARVADTLAAATWPDFSDGNFGPDLTDDSLWPDSTDGNLGHGALGPHLVTGPPGTQN